MHENTEIMQLLYSSLHIGRYPENYWFLVLIKFYGSFFCSRKYPYPSHGRLFGLNLLPPSHLKFQFLFKLYFKINLTLENPLRLGISNNSKFLIWVGMDIFWNRTFGLYRQPRYLILFHLKISLQVNLQLKIFSYLDAKSVCTAALTCHYWNMLSEDKVLWMNLMQRDMHKWSTMGYQSCPSTYMEVRSDLTLKQM